MRRNRWRRCLTALGISEANADYVVDPTLGDANASQEGDLWKFYDLAVQHAATAGQPKTVFLRAGTHLSSQPLTSEGLVVGASNVLQGLTLEGPPEAIVSAGVPLSDWTELEGGWWSCPMPTTGVWPKSLRYEGAALPVAAIRADTYDGWLHGGLLERHDPAHPKRWYALDSQLPQLTPGTAILHYSLPFKARTAIVTAHDLAAGTIDLDDPTDDGFAIDFNAIQTAVREAEYEILNDPSGMTEPGQWYYDPDVNAVVVWPSPQWVIGSTTLWAAARRSAIRLQNQDGVTLRGFSLADGNDERFGGATGGFNHDSLAYVTGNGVSAIDLRVIATAGHGIWMRSDAYSGCKALRNLVTDCGGDGIVVLGQDAVVYKNLVDRVGLFDAGGIGIVADGSNVGLSQNALVLDNVVRDAPYNGYHVIYTDGAGQNAGLSPLPHRVLYNLAENCCRRGNDGAGIYVNGGDRADILIQGNVVRGTRQENLTIAAHGGWRARLAIYADNSTRARILDNLIDDCNMAIQPNGLAASTVAHNVASFSRGDMVFLFVGQFSQEDTAGATVEHNVVSASGAAILYYPERCASLAQNAIYGGAGQSWRRFGQSALTFGQAQADGVLGPKTTGTSGVDPTLSGTDAPTSLLAVPTQSPLDALVSSAFADLSMTPAAATLLAA